MAHPHKSCSRQIWRENRTVRLRGEDRYFAYGAVREARERQRLARKARRAERRKQHAEWRDFFRRILIVEESDLQLAA